MRAGLNATLDNRQCVSLVYLIERKDAALPMPVK
jgi:hypothetical protein